MTLSLVLSMMCRFSFIGVVLTGFSFMGFGSLTAMDQDDVSPASRPSLPSGQQGPSDHDEVLLVGSSVQDDPRPLVSGESVSEQAPEGLAAPALKEDVVVTQNEIVRNLFNEWYARYDQARKEVERTKNEVANYGRAFTAKRVAFVKEQLEQGNHLWDDYIVSEERYPNNPEAQEIIKETETVDEGLKLLQEERKDREARVAQLKSAIEEHIDLMVKEGLLTKDEAYGEYNSLATINRIVKEKSF